MIEPDTASIIQFLLNATEIATPYYRSMPQDFEVPSIYFPPPVLSSRGDTLLTYGLRYLWYIKIFAASSEEAYNHAIRAVTALQGVRCTIPVIDVDGNKTGSYVRVDSPSAKVIADGVAQLEVGWLRPKPYDSTIEAMGAIPTIAIPFKWRVK